MKLPIISEIVENDLCIGCGICAGLCPSQVLEMEWNQYGEYIPKGNSCNGCDICLKVCPFADCNENEDSIGKKIYGTLNEIKHTPEIGYYLYSYVGFSIENRLRSASGGLVTWTLEQLLEDEYADYIICVAPQDNSEKLFDFEITDNINSLKKNAGSVYYPVEMSNIIQIILKNPGRYAITGLPCFIKALRLACQKNHILEKRIAFTIGLVCGQLKSKHYTTYMANLAKIQPPFKKVYYRGKVLDKPANDFYYYYKNMDNEEGKIHWNQGISDVWVNRWFTPNACNYCDDVFAELADVAFMDAWLPEYSKDGRGTNLVISRSPIISKIINEGIENGQLEVENIPIHRVIKSQAGVLDSKRNRLSYRLNLAEKNRQKVPAKRVASNKNINILKKLEVQLQLKMQNESKHSVSRIYYDNKDQSIDSISDRMKFYQLLIRLLKSSGKLFIPVKFVKKLLRG